MYSLSLKVILLALKSSLLQTYAYILISFCVTQDSDLYHFVFNLYTSYLEWTFIIY